MHMHGFEETALLGLPVAIEGPAAVLSIHQCDQQQIAHDLLTAGAG